MKSIKAGILFMPIECELLNLLLGKHYKAEERIISISHYATE